MEGPGRRDRGAVVPVVVVVDIDDDLGQVLGKSLLVGEEEVARAALEYGINRPQDPDVNALLSGINLYRRLLETHGRAELIAVGGHPDDFLEAQRLIRDRVESVVSKLDGTPEFYIVSDGEDEFVISQLLSSIGRIGGFRRVIVEQSLDIEGRYLLILKYVKKAMFDPRFSKYFLGIPGIALAVFSGLSLLGLASAAAKAAGLIIGIAMFLRGFNLEEILEAELARFLQGIMEKPYLRIGGLTVLLIALMASFYTAHQSIGQSGVSGIEKLAEISKTSIPLLMAGAASYLLLAGVLHKMVYGEEGILKDIAGIAASIFIAIAFYQLGDYIVELKVREITVSLFIESGFIQFIISGTGIAAIIEMVRRVRSG